MIVRTKTKHNGTVQTKKSMNCKQLAGYCENTFESQHTGHWCKKHWC